MAKVTIQRVDPTPPKKEYVIVLSEQEAGELLEVMSRLGGGGDSALRRGPDRLYLALGDAGVQPRSLAGGPLRINA